MNSGIESDEFPVPQPDNVKHQRAGDDGVPSESGPVADSTVAYAINPPTVTAIIATTNTLDH